MLDLVASDRQRAFGQAKKDTLTGQCRSCDMLMFCNGGCPKDRFIESRDGEPGQNYLCDGLYHFFSHVKPTMTVMAQLLQRGEPAARVMEMVSAEDALRGRNDPCPCGNGAKFKRCHGAPSRARLRGGASTADG